ncbi:MAG: hypothetical protein ACYC8V_01415 [Caulobacteraceae bacterium]
MNKILTAGMAALTLGGSALAAAPASAHEWGGYGYHHDDDAGAAIAGGIVGLALGAALTSHNNGYYNGYYSQPYYGGAYAGPGYYQQGYSVCTSRRTVWDPYVGRYIVQRYRYAC